MAGLENGGTGFLGGHEDIQMFKKYFWKRERENLNSRPVNLGPKFFLLATKISHYQNYVQLFSVIGRLHQSRRSC